MSDNSIHFAGNATREPELRFTPGGRAVANFSVASNRRYQQNGEWVEEVVFCNVIAWGDLGEHVASSLHKGDRVSVDGRLSIRSYDKDGDKKYVTEIIADDVSVSLKWATAEVARVRRETATAGAPAANGAGAGGDPIYGGDEPF